MSEPYVAADFVDGRWGEITNPVRRAGPGDNRLVVSSYEPTNDARVAQAVVVAKKALSAWASKTPMDRARIIAKFLNVAHEKADEVAALMRLEAGKPIHEAIGEVLKGIQILEWALGIGHRLGGITRSGEGGAVELLTRARPLGVVALITPWNFPWAVPVWKIAPALIAGNTIVFKGSEHTPAMNTMIADLLQAAGVPDGVFNMVQGGRQVVESLIVHPDVRAVSFTGSTQVGRSIHRHMAEYRYDVIPFQAELGGNNAVYVSEAADLDLAVEGIKAGKFGSAGQRCTATQRVVVYQKVYATLLERLRGKVEQIQLGLSDDPGFKTMGPLVTSEHRDRVEAMYRNAMEAGAESLWTPPPLYGDLSHGNYLPPLGLLVQNRRSSIWREEIFGPVLVVHSVGSFEEGIEAVNDSDYGFAASIYSEDRRELQAFRDRVEAGMIHLNEPTAGGEPQVGFGGWKATGIGPREMDEGVDFFVRRQTIFDSSSTVGGKLAAR